MELRCSRTFLYRLTYQVFPDNVTFGQVLLLSSPGRVVQQDTELCLGMCTYGRPAVCRAPVSFTPTSRPSHPDPMHTLAGQGPHCSRSCSREAPAPVAHHSHARSPPHLPSAPVPADLRCVSGLLSAPCQGEPVTQGPSFSSPSPSL